MRVCIGNSAVLVHSVGRSRPVASSFHRIGSFIFSYFVSSLAPFTLTLFGMFYYCVFEAMFKGIEDHPGRWARVVSYIHSRVTGASRSYFPSIGMGFALFFAFVVVHLMKGIACFDRSATRRGGSIMALHSRYLVIFFFLLVLFLLFPVHLCALWQQKSLENHGIDHGWDTLERILLGVLGIFLLSHENFSRRRISDMRGNGLGIVSATGLF